MLSMGEYANILGSTEPLRSRALALEVLALAEDLHVPHFIGVSWGLLTEGALVRGDLQEARIYLERSRALLSSEDKVGLHIHKLQEALLCLHARSFERGEALVLEVMRASKEFPFIATYVQELSLLLALASQRQERFLQLRSQLQDISPSAAAACALGDLLFSPENDEEAFQVLLARLTQVEHPSESWGGLLEYVWRLALLEFPERLLPHRKLPTIVVGAEVDWFISPEGKRVMLAVGSHLQRIFAALLERHGPEPQALDTFALFERGWPDQSIQPAAMKNRVYVSIAKLRKAGLQGDLCKGPAGYFFAPTLCIVRIP